MGRYRHHGLLSSYGPTDYARADDALSAVEASHLANQIFGSSRAASSSWCGWPSSACKKRPCTCLDEPTQQLDVYHRRRVFTLLSNWGTAEGRTILCSTHDLDSLPDLPGFLLNMSRSRPELVPITAAAVQAERNFLERKQA